MIKVVKFGWQFSGSFNAGTSIGTISLTNIGEGTVPSGYTFAGWLMFVTNGWVGHVYPANPNSSTSTIWTSSGKSATTGISIYGTALFIKTECI